MHFMSRAHTATTATARSPLPLPHPHPPPPPPSPPPPLLRHASLSGKATWVYALVARHRGSSTNKVLLSIVVSSWDNLSTTTNTATRTATAALPRHDYCHCQSTPLPVLPPDGLGLESGNETGLFRDFPH